MASLVEELLEDWADGDEAAELENDFNESEGPDNSDDSMVDEEAEAAEKEAKKKKGEKRPSDIRSAEGLHEKLSLVLREIEELKDNMDDDLDSSSIEESKGYQLMKEANEFSSQIDDNITQVHKFIRDNYSIKFPYLEELVRNPVQFAKTVAILQNGPLNDIKTISQNPNNIVGVPLNKILDAPSLMVVTVEAVRADSAGQGRNLTDTELQAIVGACQLLLSLDKGKDVLTSFVQSRMTIFAPNLTELVGSLAAAQLISASGGITGLAQKPACNIPAIGSRRHQGLGLASNVGGAKHKGVLFDSPIVQTVRPDLKQQAMRIISAKVILAARVDMVHSSPDGSTGRTLKDECEKRLDKLTEIPANKGVRALPAPDDKPSRKRGGRRARKAKEATAMTEIRKAQNRMAFGKEEKEVGYGDTTKGMGMIGATDTGRLRAQQIDPKTRAKLSKKNAGWGGDTTLGAASSLKGFGTAGTATTLRNQGLRTGGVGLGGAGTSSIAFTPVQGLELVDPKKREEMNRKRKADEDRWFKGGSFTNLNGGAGKVDAGGFKVPALPPKKPKTDS